MHEFIFITKFQKLLKLHHSRARWSSFDVPTFGKQHVEVWGWQSGELHSNTCSTGWLPPTLPTARSFQREGAQVSEQVWTCHAATDQLTHHSPDGTSRSECSLPTAWLHLRPGTRGVLLARQFVGFFIPERRSESTGALLPCPSKLHLSNLVARTAI